jgi:hypothetical protein
MMDAQDLDLEQYRSLRAEIIRAMEDGNQIMGFGLAAIGFIMTAGLNVRETTLGFFMFSVMVPALSSLVLSMWFAAQERIARASYFITGIERRLKDSLNIHNVPTWDLWLRTPSKARKSKSQHHFWNTEFSGIGIFAFLMFGPLSLSPLLGGGYVSPRIRMLTIILSAGAILAYFFWLRIRVHRWRGWLSKSFGEFD